MYQVEVFFTFDQMRDAVAFGDSMLEHENSATYVVRDTRDSVITLTGAEVEVLRNLVMRTDSATQPPSAGIDQLKAKVEDSF